MNHNSTIQLLLTVKHFPMSDKITCPNCGHTFDIEEALAEKIERHFKEEYQRKLREEHQKLQRQQQQLDQLRQQLEAQQREQDKILQQQLETLLRKERQKIQQEFLNNYQSQIQELHQKLKQKEQETQALKDKELQLLRKERELLDREKSIQIELEKRLLEERRQLEEKARQQLEEVYGLKMRELQKQLDEQKALVDELKRKAEQGPIQLQGEVQELAIEEFLKAAFPFDQIEEVPKGIRGADCIQTVYNRLQQPCGKIVYESKRTKHFSYEWIDKLKQDLVSCKADLAVLVTQAMPPDMHRFGIINGVYVCSFEHLKNIVHILREMLIRIHSVKTSQVNKADKMELLYQYLTSQEFVQTVQRIIENFSSMSQQLEREKRAMQRLWKEREKQIWAVQENLSALFGAIRGIAGKELDTIDLLELPSADDPID